MNEDKFKQLIGDALAEFMESERGRQLFGDIVLSAIRQHFYTYSLDMEKTHPDGSVEKFKHKGDPLALICKWIKDTEGAMRGFQVDIAKTKNRATQVRSILATLAARPANIETRRLGNGTD